MLFSPFPSLKISPCCQETALTQAGICSAMFFLPFHCLLMKDYVHVQNKFDSFTETYLSVLENNIWDWKVFFPRWTAALQKYITQTPAYATPLTFLQAHLTGGDFQCKGGCDSHRQGTSTPPTPHTQTRCVLLLNFVVLSRKWYVHC